MDFTTPDGVSPEQGWAQLLRFGLQDPVRCSPSLTPTVQQTPQSVNLSSVVLAVSQCSFYFKWTYLLLHLLKPSLPVTSKSSTQPTHVTRGRVGSLLYSRRTSCISFLEFPSWLPRFKRGRETSLASLPLEKLFSNYREYKLEGE